MKNIEKILWAMNNCPHKFQFKINNEGINMAFFDEEGKYNITVSPQLYRGVNPETGEEMLSTFPIGERIQDEQMLSKFAEGVILHELFHLYRGDLLKEYDEKSDIPLGTQQYLYNIASDVVINHWLNNPIISMIGVTWEKLAGKYPDLPAINKGTEGIYEYLINKYKEEKEKLEEELQKLGENIDVIRELWGGENNGENKEEDNQNEKEEDNNESERGNENGNKGNQNEKEEKDSNKENEKGNENGNGGNQNEKEGGEGNKENEEGNENENESAKRSKENGENENKGKGSKRGNKSENGNRESEGKNENNQGKNYKNDEEGSGESESGNNMSEEVKEKLDRIRVYAREVLRNSGSGNMPNPTKGEIPPIKKNKLSKELEEAIKAVNQLVKHVYRMRRNHRRIPSGDYRILKVQPQKRYFPDMHVYIDVSGSIGEKVIEILSGYNLLPPENIWVFSDRVEKMKNLNEVIYGGTLFAPIWKNVQKTKPRNVVIISDFFFGDATEEEIERKFKKERIMLHKIMV